MKAVSEEGGKGANTEQCPIVEAIRQIGGEWNMIVVRYLMEKPMGFNEMLRAANGMNSKTLSRVLKSLQAKNIVYRRVVSTQPFSVEYSLTEKGQALQAIMKDLRNWGNEWVMGNRSNTVETA